MPAGTNPAAEAHRVTIVIDRDHANFGPPGGLYSPKPRSSDMQVRNLDPIGPGCPPTRSSSNSNFHVDHLETPVTSETVKTDLQNPRQSRCSDPGTEVCLMFAENDNGREKNERSTCLLRKNLSNYP
jgi:hypothetical protein